MCLSASAHVAEQFYSSFDEDREVLKVNFDIGYAIAEDRDNPDTAQPRRSWLLERSDTEHESFRLEAEGYLRKYISFISNGDEVEYGVRFSDFDSSPVSFPKLLNEGAYYTVELIPRRHKLGGLAIKVTNKAAPKLVVAFGSGDKMDFRLLEESDGALMLLEAPEIGAFERYGAVIGIGLRHVIPEGLDHILFIIGICLSAHGFRNLLVQSLLFTLAHSISMVFVISGWLRVYSYGGSSWIEPLIALSISFIAVEALLKRKSGKYRYAVIASFGLIHGLGFAGSMGSSLQAITPDGGHWITALLWANLGIELAQAILVIVVSGLFYAIGRTHYRDDERNFKMVTALALGITGLVMFFQRL